jgi:L-2-hydroxycarboxylate dehydrogenase (NAD+)
MAASVVAAGKLEIARRRGKEIPVGWVRDGDGEDVTDPDVYYESEGMGGLLPLGSDVLTGAWKGFGLAIMVDVLTGVLSGGHTSSELPRRAANHFFGAMRIDAFTDVETFYDQMQSMKDNLRASPRLPGAGPLTFAGEPEAAFEAGCRANGIPYHPSVVAGIRDLCEEIGVGYDLE